VSDPRQTQRTRQVGPYQLLQQIGVGAMGEVYLVQHVESQERFALKRIRGDFADDEELTRFRREAELVARLHHPHVIRLRDSNFATSHPYQVYELYEGGTLAERLSRTGPMPVGDALEIVRKLGEALSHAHAQGVLHRDLKPENVLFSAAGEPALADFGLARRAVSRGNSLTATGEAIGTPLYMAPEQALDSKRVDERADLYGLAAITYALLSGGPPVSGANTVLEAFDKVINEMPPPLRREDVPARVERALFSGLAKDPDERPESVASWVDQLVAATERRGPSPTRIAGSLVLTLLIVGLLGVVALALGLVGDSAPPPAPSPSHVDLSPRALSGDSEAHSERPPLGAPGAVPPAPIRQLVPRDQGWAWLTLTPPGEVGVSLLVSCNWGEESLYVNVVRGRYVSGGKILDTVWNPSEEHLAALTRAEQVWTLEADGEVSRGPAPEGVSLLTPAGELLKRCLDPEASSALFRLLAAAPSENPEAPRSAEWGEDRFTWEPLLWGGQIHGTEQERGPAFEKAPSYVKEELTKLEADASAVGRSLTRRSWLEALTLNRCRNLADEPFPEKAHFALPYGPKVLNLESLGSVQLEGRTPVLASPGGVLQGLSPYQRTRYVVHGEREGWLKIGWGSALGWVERESYSKSTGPVFVLIAIPLLNVRQRPHYPGVDWGKKLGPSPVLGQIPMGRSYPFVGFVSGPPRELELEVFRPPVLGLGEQRWAKIQFDDRQVWASWWAKGEFDPHVQHAQILFPSK
jgi:serine/threonine protein kinase